jgi:hypothetical protein
MRGAGEADSREGPVAKQHQEDGESLKLRPPAANRGGATSTAADKSIAPPCRRACQGFVSPASESSHVGSTINMMAGKRSAPPYRISSQRKTRITMCTACSRPTFLALSRVAGRSGRSQTPSYLPNITQLLLESRGATTVFNAVLCGEHALEGFV